MHTASVTQLIADPPSEAWKDLTLGARLSRWFADSRDLAEEGAFRFDFGDGDYFAGEVTRWEPARALGLKWRFMGVGPAFDVRFDLAPHATGTEVKVEDRGSRTAAEADSLREGWRDFLQRLGTFAETKANSRYEWSPTIGTAALVNAPPPRVAKRLRDPAWWRGAFEGLEPALAASGDHQFTAELQDEAWAGKWTRAVVTVEPTQGGAYVGVTHAGWTELPENIQRAERRRFAGLWARALGALERGR